MDIQELISRGRFIFSRAPKRLEVFKLVNGKRSAKEIARKSGKSLASALNDLAKMRDMELIWQKKDENGRIVKRENSVVYEKIPLVRQIPISYFKDPYKGQTKLARPARLTSRGKPGRLPPIRVPNENEILEICRSLEDQIYEFKGAGTDIQKITKEVAAFLNTKLGGLVFYGIDDDGVIMGSDIRRQQLDQSLQNSIKNTISPSATVQIQTREVVGYRIIIVIVPPWNRKDVYQHKGRTYIRKGTNVFVAKSDEVRRLHDGEYIV